MKIKTSELTGAALDWAVAKCEHPKTFNSHNTLRSIWSFRYSTDWSQGGPIIERESMELLQMRNPNYVQARVLFGVWLPGPTPLIAAMRCYVASKLGDEVEVPDELIKE
jgi:hypothetical protein